MKLSICTDAVYRGIPTPEAVRLARENEYDAIEFWSWWDKDLASIREAAEANGVTVATFCTRFVSLVDPDCRSEYIEGLKQSIEAARSVGCVRLITQTGDDRPGVSRELQRQHMIDGLRECVPLLEAAGVTLLVEPLNTAVDHPGYYLSSAEEAFSIVREVGSRKVKVLYDIYHQQITEGDLIRTIRANVEWIGHFHAAGHPGRGELHNGEINYPYVFAAIRETGYQGYVGLEYFGSEPTEAALARALEMTR
ncbi:hydroxypyruvate isomerase family protein [Cohnella sp. AR92]|uniref:hydroxypyruvate isomerase family protein n=1 Tax=Cohnella sp. AR92 TaxID=648716 RepID=UPI000F8F7070|nr:TIM barrel protein [Cohnella sp. AR92]RUS47839.1 glyoxylate-induced protein [Cohnella sp. AR92]